MDLTRTLFLQHVRLKLKHNIVCLFELPTCGCHGHSALFQAGMTQGHQSLLHPYSCVPGKTGWALLACAESYSCFCKWWLRRNSSVADTGMGVWFKQNPCSGDERSKLRCFFWAVRILFASCWTLFQDGEIFFRLESCRYWKKSRDLGTKSLQPRWKIQTLIFHLNGCKDFACQLLEVISRWRYLSLCCTQRKKTPDEDEGVLVPGAWAPPVLYDDAEAEFR